MEKQVAIGDGIDAAVAEEAVDVLLELLAAHERVVKLCDNILLLGSEAIWVGRIDGGEVAVGHLILLAIKHKHLPLEIDVVEQKAVGHVEVGASLDCSRFELKLNHADSLMPLGNHVHGLFAQTLLEAVHLGHKHSARVVGIGFEGKGGKRQQIDSIAIFEHSLVAIAQGYAQHIGNAAVVSGGGTHPQYVVIAPLHIKVVIVAEDFHNLVGAWTAVEHVAENVQCVDSELLDKVTD